MLPVQHPYTGKWQHLPVSAIKSHVDLYDASYDTKGVAAFSCEHFIVEDGFVKINLGTINFDSYFYEQNGELHCKLNFVGDLDVSAFGGASGSGGPGVDLIDNLTSARTDAALTANMGRHLKSLIDSKASDWNSITGKPSAFTPSAHTHTWTDIPGRPDFDAIYVKKSGDAMLGNLTIGTNWIMGPGGNGLLFSDGANSNIGTRTGITKLRSGATNLVHLKNESGTDRGYTVWDASNSNLPTVDWSVNQLTFPGTQFNVNAPARSTMNPMSLKIWDSYGQNIGVGSNYATVIEIYGKKNHWDNQIAFDGFKGSMYYRNSTHTETTFSEWRKIWDSNNSNLLSVDWKANLLTANRVAVGYDNTSYTLSTYSFISSKWVRTLGTTGWFSESYGGGIHMSDTDYVRIYNNKRFYVSNTSAYSILSDGGFTRQGYGGSSWGQGYGAFNVAVTNNNSQTPIIVAYRAGQTPSTTGVNRLLSMEFLNNGDRMRWYFGGVQAFEFSSSGTLIAAGDIIAYTASDARLKNNVRELDGLSYINRLRPVSFDWNERARKLAGDNRQHGYGLIAQELQNVLPDCVGNIYNSEFLGVKYEKLIPFLIAAVKQLSEEVKQLKER